MNEPKFTLTLETRLGASLKDTIIDAIRISRQLNVIVKFDFWDEDLTVWPDTELEKFLSLNKQRLGL